MLSTSDTINKFTSQGEPPVLGPAFTIGNFSNQVNTEVINNGEYTVTGYNVYAIRNTTGYSDVANASRTGLDAAGNFTITCTRTAEISFIIIGSGGGGTSHSQGTGGPSSGQARYIKISLNPGTYNCNYNVGVGGCGGGWGTAPSMSIHGGKNSFLTINGTTYTAFGGVCSGQTIYQASHINTYYSNGSSWGGAGRSCLLGYVGTVSGYKGSVQTYFGGSVSNSSSVSACSGAGGSGENSNGENGTTGNVSNLRASGPGGKGGDPISFNNYPEFNFDSGTKYFAEGGSGSTTYLYTQNFVIPEGIDVLPTPTTVGGRGNGIRTSTNSHCGVNYAATDAVQHTGSGGGSSLNFTGRINSSGNTTSMAGNGANGIIIISFQA